MFEENPFEDDDYEGSYEQYEDWFAERGYDPYHVFDDEFRPSVKTRLIRAVRHFVGRVGMFIIEVRYGHAAAHKDDIPF